MVYTNVAFAQSHYTKSPTCKYFKQGTENKGDDRRCLVCLNEKKKEREAKAKEKIKNDAIAARKKAEAEEQARKRKEEAEENQDLIF